MQGEIRAAGSAEVLPTDIVFECPQCGKSLAIDARGAGLIVRCPQCQAEIRVPGEPPEAEPEDVQTDDEASAAMDETVESLQQTVSRLNHMLAAEAERRQRIVAELELIQAALDRLVELLAEAPPPPKP